MIRAAKTRFAALLLLLIPSVSRAQEHPPGVAQGGNWDFSIWFAGATGEETRNSFTEVNLWTAGGYIGRAITREMGSSWRRGRLELGATIIPVFVQTKLHTIYGGGFEPVVVRWNSGLHLRRASPYIELAGGGVFTKANLPPGNTSSFNFSARGGGGINLFTRDRQTLDLSCRWYHVSNANLGTWNPEFNGIQVAVGYHWWK